MKPKIVIGVGIASYPINAAGNTWAFLQWVLGFRACGWDVWMVEELAQDRSIDANHQKVSLTDSINWQYWKRVCDEFGIHQATLLGDGLPDNTEALKRFAAESELFFNISGHFKTASILSLPRRRVYVDLDPAFTQIWAEVYGANMNLDGHDQFVTVGRRLGRSDCVSPTVGRDWIPTLPPVNLEYWSSNGLPPDDAPWTTVTHWYGYPAVEYQNQWFGNKSEEFEKLIALPGRVKERLEIATDLTPDLDEHRRFSQAGWRLRLAGPLNEPWQTYRQYLAESRGEFCVAKNGYVRSRCGWFSDRSVCYLALGRPVILQETGWSEFLPAEKGLLAFHDLDSAQQALETVARDYRSHAIAARELAEKELTATVVVPRLLKRLGL